MSYAILWYRIHVPRTVKLVLWTIEYLLMSRISASWAVYRHTIASFFSSSCRIIFCGVHAVVRWHRTDKSSTAHTTCFMDHRILHDLWCPIASSQVKIEAARGWTCCAPSQVKTCLLNNNRTVVSTAILHSITYEQHIQRLSKFTSFCGSLSIAYGGKVHTTIATMVASADNNRHAYTLLIKAS